MPTPDLATSSDLVKYRDGDDAAIVGQVQAAVRRYCGWHVGPSLSETITLDGSGATALALPSLHVTAVTAVTEAGVALDLTKDLDWSSAGFLRRRSGRFTDRPGQISVTMTHGFDPAPPDVVEVIVSVASRAASSPVGALSEAAGGMSVTFGAFNGVAGGVALLAHEREILDLYRLPPRA